MKLDQLEQVDKDIKRIQRTLATNEKFLEALCNPSVDRIFKKKYLVERLPKATGGAVLSEPVKNFMYLLADNGRLNLVNRILYAFSEIMKGYYNLIDVCIVSATVSTIIMRYIYTVSLGVERRDKAKT